MTTETFCRIFVSDCAGKSVSGHASADTFSPSVGGRKSVCRAEHSQHTRMVAALRNPLTHTPARQSIHRTRSRGHADITFFATPGLVGRVGVKRCGKQQQ